MADRVFFLFSLQIEKLFDVACTLTDVMACVPMEQNSFEIGPRDYLGRFLNLISTLRGGQSRYLALLLQKINEVLPNMAVPMPRGLSATSTPANARLDDLYESPASVSAQGSHVGSHEATPFESPPPMSMPVPVRQSSHSSMPYPDMQVTPPLVPQNQGFPTFSTAMGFAQSTTTAAPPQGVYQTHPQHGGHGGFPG